MLSDKILILSPHPDDEAIGCGGLIMKAKHEQKKVHVLYISIGSSRQFTRKTTTATERLPEIKAAAKYGDFSYGIAFKGKAFMRLDSLPQKDIIEKIEDTIEMLKPDLIALPYKHSYDQDHRALATAAITALRPLPLHVRHQLKFILEYEEPYTWSTDLPFHPNLYLDISEIFDEKINLLKKHASQMREEPFPRSPENLRRLAGIRGNEISVQYAESYKLLKGQI